MRGRIILALSLSVILIVVASWQRFVTAERGVSPELMVVERPAVDQAYYEELLRSYNNATSSGATQGNLTSPDIIGRQLIADYINLAAGGGADDSTLGILADRYVESIPTLISIEKFTYADIKTAPNSKLELEKYLQNFSPIYSSYAGKILGTQLRGLNNEEAAREMGLIFKEIAYKMKDIVVPNPLIQAHLNLANVYLENSIAMQAIAETSVDPGKSFAGLVVINENLTQEKVYLAEINKILERNGI